MVRAHVKQPTEDKKESSKKKTSAKKKSQETGVWPCKINGCNKEFAREADLKRHQRTTKLHSQPGLCVSCPQCEATFTRTDALRRHQKSRHNGIIMEPVESEDKMKDGGEDDSGSIGSANHSRSGTPSKSRGINPSASSLVSAASHSVPTVLARPDTAGPASGAQSYYRQHTVNPVFVPPHTPHGVLDSSSYQAGTQLPTSATRLNGNTWPPALPWIHDVNNAQQPPPGTLPYPVPPHGGYYPPGAYYRSATGQPAVGQGLSSSHHQLNVAQMQAAAEAAHSNGREIHPSTSGAQNVKVNEASSTSNSNIDPNLGNGSSADVNVKDGEHSRLPQIPDATSFADHAGINAAVRKALQAVLAIDPSLNSALPSGSLSTPPSSEQQDAHHLTGTRPNQSPAHNLNLQPSIASHVSSVDANARSGSPSGLKATARQRSPDAPVSEKKEAGQTEEFTRSGAVANADNSYKDGDIDVDADADGEADVDGEGDLDGQLANTEGPGPPHHVPSHPMLTADGEPMLRPDELLNEESLASLPSS